LATSSENNNGTRTNPISRTARPTAPAAEPLRQAYDCLILHLVSRSFCPHRAAPT
jgi:hypothetical protein